ncbi:thiamine pyrophosphokinase [Eremomyces bilateralis CBS 781.70]|uniref:Thiamine pyrophosphokinase n=1 Tax=Eremomyces bilateralis CBS 781.70 TaxID=1392243 RepID=A0A6G1G1I9_9PEZI|nr:thiamine pyrophosphokinase [Eremomyces bilateralis CBS 781.70]KAF1811790.1 thiamine pyrophosphokinase [Eremomyces bilateralis CBS 781.70]
MRRVFHPTIHLGDAKGSGATRPSGVKLLLLNQPIYRPDLLFQLWENSLARVCADGAANRLFDAFAPDQSETRRTYLPDEIVGDLDSIRDDVKSYYAREQVQVTFVDDQESTDFGKAMRSLKSSTYQATTDIMVFGGIGGRIDQGIGLLHEILREHHHDPQTRLWLISESSISFLLLPGENIIETKFSQGYFTHQAGVLPIYGPATITTQGFEWDVNNWFTSMGGRVSTSNHIVQDTVCVTTDKMVLFTVEIAHDLPKMG